MELWTLLATFTRPEAINTTPGSLLWIIPLLVSFSIVYKATKVRKIQLKSFTKECALLFGSILVFIVVAALVLCLVAKFFNDILPSLRGITV